jgi:hypothetical protein
VRPNAMSTHEYPQRIHEYSDALIVGAILWIIVDKDWVQDPI